MDPQHPATIYVAGFGLGVFKSADGGATWSSTGPPGAFLLSLAMDSSDATTIYLGSDSSTAGPGKVFKTSDGGASWTDVSNGLSTARWPARS